MDNENKTLRYVDLEDVDQHDKRVVRQYLFSNAIVANGAVIGSNTHSNGIWSPRIVACLIANKFRKNPAEIVIAISSEGFPGSYIQQADTIFKILKEKYNISDEYFHLLLGASPVKHNFDLYKEYCDKFGWLPVKLHLSNMWESSGSFNLNLSLPEVENIVTEPIVKKKKVLCLNGVSRAHRLYVVGEFIIRNLLSCAHYSFLNRSPIIQEMETLRQVVEENNMSSVKFDEIKTALISHADKFPMLLNYPVSNPKHYVTPDDVPLYNETYFSLVNETLCFGKNKNPMDEVSMDCFFITEKTFRPIMAKHPFIIVGRPHILKHLRDIGYKTFSPFIDESYDDIEDDELRLQKIMDIVEHMCKKFSDLDWLELQQNTLEARLHNHAKLLASSELHVLTENQNDFY